MDGRLLAQGLLQAKGDELRLVYALLVETKMLQLLTSRVKDTFNKEVNHLEQDLDGIIAKLQHVSDEELQLKLFLHMLEQLEIRGAHYNIYTEIEHACEQIVAKAYALQIKQDKDFKAFAENRTEEMMAVQLVLYQMQKIFADFDAKIGELSDDQTEHLVKQIEGYIEALPADKQRQIQEKLNIDELTTKTLRQLVLSQGTVLVMTIVVEVAGFAAFTTLTSFMATAAGLIGLTLPFGAYLFATSALSILTGPIGIGLALIGGGALMKYQSDKLRRTLIPIGVVQLLLPVVVTEDEPKPSAEHFIAKWLPLYEKQQQLKATIREYEQHNEQLTVSKQQVQRDINEQMQEINRATAMLDTKYSELIPMVTQIPTTLYTEKATELKAQMEQKQLQINERLDEIQRNQKQTGFFNAIKSTFSNYQLTSEIETKQMQYDKLERLILEELVRKKPAQILPQSIEIEAIHLELTIAMQKREQLDMQKQQLITEIDNNSTVIKLTTKQLKDHQKQYYGLAHIE